VSYGTPQTTGFGVVGPKTRIALKVSSPVTVTTQLTVPTPWFPTITPTPTFTPTPIITPITPPPITFSWNTSSWNTCSNNTQTRNVTCNGSDNNTYSDSKCTTNKPTTSNTCSSPVITTPNKSCSLNGKDIAHNTNTTSYLTNSVPYGQTCQSQTRTCTNGTLSGTYTNSTCLVGNAQVCSFNGQTIAHSSNVTAYQNETVPFGGTCKSQTRTCNNGTLSGAYTNSACSVDPQGEPTFRILGQRKNKWSIGKDQNGNQPWSEIPPWITRGGWYGYHIASGNSYFYSTQDNLLTNPNAFTVGQQKPYRSATTWGEVTDVSSLRAAEIENNIALENLSPWRRTYNAVYSSFVLGDSLITINHGENKNVIKQGVFKQNTINPRIGNDCVTADTECWPAYHAFIFSNHWWWKQGEGWGNKLKEELGPIIWPAAGYTYDRSIDNNTGLGKASSGVQSPTVFIYNGMIYIYYRDSGFYDGASTAARNYIGLVGRWERGVKVARAPISGQARPGTFKTLYNGQFSESSLPANFSAENMSSFLNVPGPRGDLLIDRSFNVQRFAVAKFKGQDLFVAAVYYLPQGRPTLGFSYSSDLISWSKPEEIMSAGSQRDFDLNYPIIANKEGTSNLSEIDPNNFIVYGTDQNNDITVLNMSVDLIKARSLVPNSSTPPRK